MVRDKHFTVKAKHFDDSIANRTGFLRMHKQSHGDDVYYLGEFVDPRGIVTVYRQSDHTRLDFAHAERLFIRSWQTYFGDRTIARLARAFISDVLSGDPQ